MEAETVVFMLDISDERIKRKAMEAVWKFSGVTFVDVREIGRLKIRGIFKQIEMGSKLLKIDNSVVIIHETENHIPVFSSFLQNIEVFKFKVLSENILRKANIVIWQFPGVTSVEVKGDHQLQVIGEFNNVVMGVKLTEVDKSVHIVKVGPNVEAPPQKNMGYRNSFSARSRGQPEEETNNKPLVGVARARARELAAQAAEKEKAKMPINLRAMGKEKEIKYLHHQQKVAFGALNNAHPPIMQQQQEGGFLAKIFDNKKPPEDKWFLPNLNARHFPVEKPKAHKQVIKKEKPEGEKTQAPTHGSSIYSTSSWNPSRSNQSGSSFGDSSRSNQSGSSFGDSSRSNQSSSSFGDSSRSNQSSSSFGDSSRSNQSGNSRNPYQSLTGTSGSTQFHTSTQPPRKESFTEKWTKDKSKI